MSQTTDYVFNGQSYATLELSREAATALEEIIFSDFDLFCEITVVEPHHKIPNAFIVDNQLIDFDCRTLNDNDPRFFNVSAVVTGITYQGIRAVELKQRHRELFEEYVAVKQLKFVKKHTYPSRFDADPDASLQDSDLFTEEVLSSNVAFNYA